MGSARCPDGAAVDEAFDVAAAEEGNVLAETLAVDFGEAAVVLDFLGAHAVENFGGGGVVGAEARGDVGVDSGVFFFRGDGDGEDFLFGEVDEAFGHWGSEKVEGAGDFIKL